MGVAHSHPGLEPDPIVWDTLPEPNKPDTSYGLHQGTPIPPGPNAITDDFPERWWARQDSNLGGHL